MQSATSFQVLMDIDNRIADWLMSGGNEDDPYVWQQLRYARNVSELMERGEGGMTTETNAERLDRIKKNWINHKLQMVDKDVSWIIEQAERAERAQQLEIGVMHWESTALDFAKENARLREALKSILEPLNQTSYEKEHTYRQIAREALAGNANGQRKA